MVAANNRPAASTRPLTFISMFSGIEAASVAFGPLGWKALAFAEIEKFPSAVLAHHYPDVPNVGDMSKHDWSQYRGMVDIVCGGPPCQAFSVAGLRESMNDARGNLSLVYMRALHAIKPRNAIVENVPGWLNTPDNAFGCFLAGIVGADDALRTPDGKSWPNAGMVAGPLGRAAWRVLDAQYFGLAQRRRRVILVADFGNGADPAAVLFERASLSGNTPPSREKGKDVAGTIAGGAGGCGGLGTDFDLDGGLVDVKAYALQGAGKTSQGSQGSGWNEEVCFTLNRIDEHGVAYVPEIARCDATREGSSQDYETTTMVATAFGWQNSASQGDGVSEYISPTLDKSKTPAVAFTTEQTPKFSEEKALTLTKQSPSGGGQIQSVMVHSAVRRLTPRECERLQGFPDDYTNIPWRGKQTSPDGPRYKALGNSWAVPKFRWLGERINRLMPHAAANDNTKQDTTIAA